MALRESQKTKAALVLLEGRGWLMSPEAGTIVRGKARTEAWRIVKGCGDVV